MLGVNHPYFWFNIHIKTLLTLLFNDSGNDGAWGGLVGTLKDLEFADQSWPLSENHRKPVEDSYFLSSYELVWSSSVDLIGIWMGSNAAILKMFPILWDTGSTRLTSIQSLPQRMDQWKIWSRGDQRMITWIIFPPGCGQPGGDEETRILAFFFGFRLQKARQERMALEKQLAGDVDAG